MALYVNTNVTSLNAQRKLTNATNNLNVSYQRLASGLRINSAKDDAGGLLISNRLTSQINGLDQGNRNANDGIALAQTIEGALDETSNMLQRIRVLAVQAANGTYSQVDRDAMQREVTALCEEISRIGEKTTFAGARILDGVELAEPWRENKNLPNNLIGDTGIVTFQVGANHDDTISLDLNTGFTMTGLMIGAFGYLPAGIHSSVEDAVCYPHPETPTTNGLVKYLISKGSSTDPNPGFNPQTDVPDHFGLRWSVSSQSTSQMTLTNIDKFIQFVDSTRADLGALQNRMESTIRNQSNISENESDARSRIRDTDFAMETASLTQNNIIQQASQSILAQANQRPQVALSLLGN